MVYITTLDPVTGRAREHTWHVGNARPVINVHVVTSVQADGHELEWILERFIRIPYHTGMVNTWYGDMAKMIYSGLPTTSNR